MAGKSSLQAGRAMTARASSSSAEVGNRSRPAARDQSRESASTRGSKAPPLIVPPSIAGREDLEEFRREGHRPPGSGLPAAELAERS